MYPTSLIVMHLNKGGKLWYILHEGVSKRDGARIGSGRYPLGSGNRPYQHGVIASVNLEKDDKEEKKYNLNYKIKTKEYSKDEDMAAVNPYRTTDNAYRNNCTHCSATYDLRRRGYDITATRNINGESDDVIKSWYKDSKLVEIKSKSKFAENLGKFSLNFSLHKEVESQLLKEEDGSRGIILFEWAGLDSGHAANYEIENGKVIIRDCQINKIVKLSDYTTCSDLVSFMRTDNLEPNEKTIKRCSKNVKTK